MAETSEIVYLVKSYHMPVDTIEAIEDIEKIGVDIAPERWKGYANVACSICPEVYGTLAKATETARSGDILDKVYDSLKGHLVIVGDERIVDSFWFKNAEKFGIDGYVLRCVKVKCGEKIEDGEVVGPYITWSIGIYAVPTVVRR